MKAFARAAAALLTLTAYPLSAQDTDRFQIKLLGTAVLPDGKITRLETDLVGLPAGTQTKANDNVVPTIAFEYFLSRSISVETICCLTQHDIDATAGLPGAELVADAKLIPATLTAKYHFNAGGVSPYIGAGPTYFMFIDDEPGAAVRPLGVTDFKASDELGFALQAGIDMPVGEKGMIISFDAKRYFVDTTARWYSGNTVAIETEHALDPWVLSAGLGFRF
ncbi:OmpW/AlkL family protein [Tsuneonella sp. HG249]